MEKTVKQHIRDFDTFWLGEGYSTRIQKFQKLMRYKVREVLLVSSLYDSYLFEEDGQIYDLIRQEYQGLNLSHVPEFTHVMSGIEALEIVQEDNHFDLIITSLHIEDMHVIKFAKLMREKGVKAPIILLAYDNQEHQEIVKNYDISIFDRIFIWQGDYRLMIAIIKYIEDKMNVENDTNNVGVQSIILIEDNVKFYSTYLPIIYTEIMNQSQRLISESLNLTHKFLRMRTRPKILLSTTYDEAWKYFEKYEENILGIISDISFMREGEKDPEAGLLFAKKVRERYTDIPVLFQSSSLECAEKAREIGAGFLQKGSPRLLHELREFLIRYFHFGDFIFRNPDDGREISRANNLKTLEEQLRVIPDETLLYHAKRNHFSNWLKARTEFWLASKLRPLKTSQFESVDAMRKLLVDALSLYQELRKRGIISDFNKDTFDLKNSFARIGRGSLGGKARGLGFVNILINNYNVRNRFEGVEISVPSAVVIGTDVFERFMEDNQLFNFAMNTDDDEAITRKFVDAPKFPEDIIKKLSDFLDIIRQPLAVRSSSLLEDSQYQPFAGVYETYMIPNNDPDKNVRLRELLNSIKRVYASTFYKSSKTYMKATSYRLEEEKMAVIIQRMVGSRHENRFYPEFAGVAKSYNFYPVPPQKASDGIVSIALGLGKTVVDGGNTVRFCPKYPRHLLQFFSTKETIKNAQQNFYALNLDYKLDESVVETHDLLTQQFHLSVAEADGTLFCAGSTYSQENDSVYDGISRPGKRVVTFAPILKHKIFPLPDILNLLLEMGTWGMGTPVEMEFAVNLTVPQGALKEFCVLQMRPLVLSKELEELEVDDVEQSELICHSQQVLGNGIITDIYDAVVIDIDTFDRGKSEIVAREVGEFNTKLLAAKRPYLLIGVGRWGSLDPWLGIPVSWDQISGAVTIVESGFRNFDVTPSQGSHFFQNITSFRIGYFTVGTTIKQGYIDWDWLRAQPAIEETQFTRYLRFEKPITIKINGHQNKGIILKPK